MKGSDLVEGEFEVWGGRQWRVTNLHVEAFTHEYLGPVHWFSVSPTYLMDRRYIVDLLARAWVDNLDFMGAYEQACQWLNLEPLKLTAAEIGGCGLDAEVVLPSERNQRSQLSNIVHLDDHRRPKQQRRISNHRPGGPT